MGLGIEVGIINSAESQRLGRRIGQVNTRQSIAGVGCRRSTAGSDVSGIRGGRLRLPRKVAEAQALTPRGIT